MRGTRRPIAATLAGIGIIAILIRWRYLHGMMRIDESYTFLAYVCAPWWDALSVYSTTNNHVLHTILAKLSVTAFGSAPWAIRLPAFLAGLAIVPLTYLLARVLYGTTAALLASALVACSPILILYSVNARGYTLVVAAFLASAALGAYALRRRSRPAWIGFAVVSALGCYAIPIMLYPLGATVLWLALSAWIGAEPAERRPALQSLGAACVLAAALCLVFYSPVLVRSGLRELLANPWVTPSPWSQFAAMLPVSAGRLWRHLTAGESPVVVGVAAIGLVAGVLPARGDGRWPVPLLLPALLWSAALVIAMHRMPFLRVGIFLVPVVYLTIAGGLVRLGRWVPREWHIKPALAGALVVSLTLIGAIRVAGSDAVTSCAEAGCNPDAKLISTALAPALQPGDGIIGKDWDDSPVRYYLGFRDGVNLARLDPPQAQARRFFVMVRTNTGFDSTLFARILPGFVNRTLVGNFPATTLYLLRRAAPGPG